MSNQMANSVLPSYMIMIACENIVRMHFALSNVYQSLYRSPRHSPSLLSNIHTGYIIPAEIKEPTTEETFTESYYADITFTSELIR